jgi:hypothetical protein
MTRFKYIALPDESRGGVVDLGDQQGEEEGGGGGLAILEGGIATDDLGMFLQAVALTDLEIGNYGVAGCVRIVCACSAIRMWAFRVNVLLFCAT